MDYYKAPSRPSAHIPGPLHPDPRVWHHRPSITSTSPPARSAHPLPDLSSHPSAKVAPLAADAYPARLCALPIRALLNPLPLQIPHLGPSLHFGVGPTNPDLLSTGHALLAPRPVLPLPRRTRQILGLCERDDHDDLFSSRDGRPKRKDGRERRVRKKRQSQAAAARATINMLHARLRVAVGGNEGMDMSAGGGSGGGSGGKRKRGEYDSWEALSRGRSRKRTGNRPWGMVGTGGDKEGVKVGPPAGPRPCLLEPAALITSPRSSPTSSPLRSFPSSSSFPSPDQPSSLSPTSPSIGSVAMERSVALPAPPNWRAIDRSQKSGWPGWVSDEQHRQGMM